MSLKIVVAINNNTFYCVQVTLRTSLILRITLQKSSFLCLVYKFGNKI